MVLTQGIDTYRVFTERLNGTFTKREAAVHVGSKSANTLAALKPAEPVEVPVEVALKLK